MWEWEKEREEMVGSRGGDERESERKIRSFGGGEGEKIRSRGGG